MIALLSSLLIAMTIYRFIYFVSMPVDNQSKELEFYLRVSQVGQPLPSL
jgi:hypothetical protein